MRRAFRALFVLVFTGVYLMASSQDHHGHNHDHGHDHSHHQHGHNHSHADGHNHDHGTKAHDDHADHEMTYSDRVMYHIGNSNEIHLWGDLSIPLPCIFYNKDSGFEYFMSSKFHHGHNIHKGFVLNHGMARRIKPGRSYNPKAHVLSFERNEETGERFVVTDKGKYEIEAPSSLLASSSWIDFSLSKNVVVMIFTVLLIWFLFRRVLSQYRKNEGKAPKGIQAFFEPIIVFLRDEVAKPSIGHGWEKYFPFLLSLFFFILFLNLIGLIPIPGANVTGNISVTLVLALITFIITNVAGNKHYWQHVFWMPGVPLLIKPVLAIIEFLGLFTKPFTLMIRLFANISAGHIVILSLVGVIFLLGQNGESIGGAIGGSIIAIPFVLAMNVLEVFVAFLQAFIFALLSALYIGAATEEAH